MTPLKMTHGVAWGLGPGNQRRLKEHSYQPQKIRNPRIIHIASLFPSQGDECVQVKQYQELLWSLMRSWGPTLTPKPSRQHCSEAPASCVCSAAFCGLLTCPAVPDGHRPTPCTRHHANTGACSKFQANFRSPHKNVPDKNFKQLVAPLLGSPLLKYPHEQPLDRC